MLDVDYQGNRCLMERKTGFESNLIRVLLGLGKKKQEEEKKRLYEDTTQ